MVVTVAGRGKEGRGRGKGGNWRKIWRREG